MAKVSNGTSMVELLVALLVLMLIVGSLFTGLSSGYKGTERLGEESYASNHAISLLEALTRVPYSKLPDIPPGTTDSRVRSYFAGVPEFAFNGTVDPRYPRTVAVTEVSRRTLDPDDPDNSRWGALKRLCVEVSWKPRYLRGGRTRRILFQTLVTDDMEVSR